MNSHGYSDGYSGPCLWAIHVHLFIICFVDIVRSSGSIWDGVGGLVSPNADFLAWLRGLAFLFRWTATLERSLRSVDTDRLHLHAYVGSGLS